MMKDKETFVGPCSKFVDGQGWTTEIPVEMLKEKGYIKIKDLNEKFVSLKAVKVAENSPKAMKMLVESVGCVQKDTAKEICDLILEYWKVDAFVDCSWVIEVISEKYGVDLGE